MPEICMGHSQHLRHRQLERCGVKQFFTQSEKGYKQKKLQRVEEEFTS